MFEIFENKVWEFSHLCEAEDSDMAEVVESLSKSESSEVLC